jgi:diaminopimelate epimerase
MRYGFVWKEGSNINFVKQIDEHFFCVLMKEEWKMRLWLAELGRQLYDFMNATGFDHCHSIDVNVEGGKLAVSFDKKDNRYTNVF